MSDGCATACMECGAQVENRGPLKTSYFCDACKPVSGSLCALENKRQEVELSAYQQALDIKLELMAMGCELNICILCGGTKHLGACAGTALAELDQSFAALTGFAAPPGCPKCGELDCTKNHPEFT